MTQRQKENRSIEQQWVSERLFHLTGTLASMEVQLLQIQHAASTLEEEEELIMLLRNQIRQVIMMRKRETNLKKSKKQFLNELRKGN